MCHFLFDASHYGFTVRTVEAPFFRRVVVRAPRPAGPPQRRLVRRHSRTRLVERLGPPGQRSSAHTAATRDGKGIVFVAHDGEVYPAGFLPLGLGSVRDTPLAEIYRDNPVLRQIRAMEFGGRCGRCEYADLCGGSRARAYAATGDPLAEDSGLRLPAPLTAEMPLLWHPGRAGHDGSGVVGVQHLLGLGVGVVDLAGQSLLGHQIVGPTS